METVVDYDQLANDYSKNLNTMLRGFNSTHEFLDLWVHDEDDTMSLVNMIESAEAFGVKKFCIHFSKSTLERIDLGKIQETVRDLASIELKSNTDPMKLEVYLK